jgi:S-adenosylmethionine synthetase
VKTIKQIAEEFGIPKHKVKYQVEKLPKNCVEKIGEILHVNTEGVAILKGLYAEKSGEKSGEFSEEILRQMVDMLNRELEIKNKQISELTVALTAAQQTAAAAQALHAGTMKHLNDSEIAEEKPKGFFARIFNRQ